MGSKTSFGKQISTSQEPKPAPETESTDKPVPLKASAEIPGGILPKPLSAYLPGSNISPEQASGMQRWAKRVRQGPATQMTMHCSGKACPFYSQCPLVKEEIDLPVGEKCPVEEMAMDMWVTDFLVAYQITEEHPDYTPVRHLLGLLAMDMAVQLRVAWQLSNEPEIMTLDVIGTNQQGDAIEVRKVHPVLEFMNKQGSQILKKLKELLATPRAKVEAGRLGWQDPSSQAAAAQAKAAELSRLSQQSTEHDDGGPFSFETLELGSGTKKDDGDAASSRGDDAVSEA